MANRQSRIAGHGMGRRLLILGPPGAGKGTQAEMLCRAIGVPHVSTGDMLRDHADRSTELGSRAKEIMEAGDLVPDEIVIAMVEERLSAPDAACGFILDGFPRTLSQAVALDAALSETPVEVAIAIEVPESEIVARMAARGRSDDTEEAVRTRLARYREQTEPLVDFYAQRGSAIRVDGVGTLHEVLTRIVEALSR